MHDPLTYQGMYSPNSPARVTRWVKSPCPSCGSLLLVQRHTTGWQRLLGGTSENGKYSTLIRYLSGWGIP